MGLFFFVFLSVLQSKNSLICYFISYRCFTEQLYVPMDLNHVWPPLKRIRGKFIG
jgi:hypothetical protein